MRRIVIWSGVTLGAALVVSALGLGVLNGTFSQDPSTFLSVLSVASYAGIGALLATRVPQNPIGWLLLVIGIGLLFGGFASEYTTYALVTNPGSLPAPVAAAWVNNWTFVTAALIPIVLLLFPSGHVPSHRWRWVPYAVVATLVVLVASSMFRPGPIEVSTDLHVENPVGIEALHAPLTVATWVGGLALLAEAILAVVALILRYRNAEEEERQQVRWLAAVAALAGVFLVLVLVTSIGLQPHQSRAINDLAFLLFFICLSIGIPAAVAIALLKYRLYDLDIVIRKTVLYVTVAGLLLIVFVGAAVIVGGVFGRSQRRRPSRPPRSGSRSGRRCGSRAGVADRIV